MTPGFAKRIEREARPTIHRLAREVAENVKRTVNVKTGRLKRSVKVRGNKVFIGTDHWHYIEYGTRPHIIEVKGRLIHHPGHRAYAPMRRAVIGFIAPGSGFTPARSGSRFTPGNSGFRRIL